MSDENEELNQYRHIIDDDLDLVVERHPRSSIPFLLLITLFFIFSLYFITTFDQKVKQPQQTQKPSVEIDSTLIKQEIAVAINLHHLISNGDLQKVEEHIYNIDKEAMNLVANGMTPIMLAASQGNVELIDLLFAHAADPNKRGSADRTALQYAVEKNHFEAAMRLLDYGADIDAYDNGRLTPLIMAADRGFTELGVLLLERGADPNIQHSQGWTALIDAARNGDKRLVKALIKVGADKEIAMSNGMRASDIAKQNGYKKIVKILAK